ncbi:MAG: hypothetical protein EZS28_004972 [Streblomastix strix]|uniref:Uncharacterized protein n=1 Tax=Streblomastix strix TaxID=222440 RepID=A0A5J4WXH4_9EUKA|nr:MAG: hypothetical protein EZS28_004972 [Streblomastix strix]
MHSNIFNVGPWEVVLVSDFQENFDLNLKRDQESREFYHKSPVTCLLIIAHICDDYVWHIKQVYTILSRCLSHTAGFFLKCLRLIFKYPQIENLQCTRQWSDGGPPLEIKNQQEGICYLSELITFFDQQSKEIKINEDVSDKKFHIINLPSKANKLVFSNLKQSLSFTSSEGVLLAAPLSGADDNQKIVQPLKSIKGIDSSVVKRQTARDEMEELFDSFNLQQIISLQ